MYWYVVKFNDVYPLPRDFEGWPAEAAGDNSQSYDIGDKVRVQWTTERGYYEWADGTVTKHGPARPRGGGTDYYVKIDSDKFDFNEKDKEALWGRERIHPAPTPAAPYPRLHYANTHTVPY